MLRSKLRGLRRNGNGNRNGGDRRTTSSLEDCHNRNGNNNNPSTDPGPGPIPGYQRSRRSEDASSPVPPRSGGIASSHTSTSAGTSSSSIMEHEAPLESHAQIQAQTQTQAPTREDQNQILTLDSNHSETTFDSLGSGWTTLTASTGGDLFMVFPPRVYNTRMTTTTPTPCSTTSTATIPALSPRVASRSAHRRGLSSQRRGQVDHNTVNVNVNGAIVPLALSLPSSKSGTSPNNDDVLVSQSQSQSQTPFPSSSTSQPNPITTTSAHGRQVQAQAPFQRSSTTSGTAIRPRRGLGGKRMSVQTEPVSPMVSTTRRSTMEPVSPMATRPSSTMEPVSPMISTRGLSLLSPAKTPPNTRYTANNLSAAVASISMPLALPDNNNYNNNRDTRQSLTMAMLQQGLPASGLYRRREEDDGMHQSAPAALSLGDTSHHQQHSRHPRLQQQQQQVNARSSMLGSQQYHPPPQQVNNTRSMRQQQFVQQQQQQQQEQSSTRSAQQQQPQQQQSSLLLNRLPSVTNRPGLRGRREASIASRNTNTSGHNNTLSSLPDSSSHRSLLLGNSSNRHPTTPITTTTPMVTVLGAIGNSHSVLTAAAMETQAQLEQQPLYQPTQEDWAVLYNKHVEQLERKDLEIAMKLSTLPPLQGANGNDNDDEEQQGNEAEDDAVSIEGIELAMEVSRREIRQADPEEERILEIALEISKREISHSVLEEEEEAACGDDPSKANMNIINREFDGEDQQLTEEEELERVLKLSEELLLEERQAQQQQQQQPSDVTHEDEDEEFLRVLRLSEQEQQSAGNVDGYDSEEELLRVIELSQKEATDQEKERETVELVLELSRQHTNETSFW
jgi:hypothetical protein